VNPGMIPLTVPEVRRLGVLTVKRMDVAMSAVLCRLGRNWRPCLGTSVAWKQRLPLLRTRDAGDGGYADGPPVTPKDGLPRD
jgi:hypothetical protein